MKTTSDEIRLRYLYRDLILRGKIAVSLETAIKLVGPDCAFHLYAFVGSDRIKKGGARKIRK